MAQDGEYFQSNLPKGFKIWVRSQLTFEYETYDNLWSLCLPPHPDAAGRYFATTAGDPISYTISCSVAAQSVFNEVFGHWKSDILEKRNQVAEQKRLEAENERRAKEKTQNQANNHLLRNQIAQMQQARIQQQIAAANNSSAVAAASAMARAARMQAVALNNAMITQGSVFDPPGTTYGYRYGGGYSGNPGNF
ncbi:hypothetical protein ABW21_db0207857 [Orbilia brochopaga]|nr:hypothetical protein ABW21_db0207857 [Drechslerella brochopaga]